MATREIEQNQPSLLQDQLPRRLARLRRRGQRLRQGWDVNTLSLLGEDARFLAETLRPGGPDALVAALVALNDTVAPLLDPPHLPDQAGMDELAAHLDALAGLDARDDEIADAPAGIATSGPTHEDGFPLLVEPPEQYWQRFADTPPPAPAASPERAIVDSVDEAMLEAMIAAAHAGAEPPAMETFSAYGIDDTAAGSADHATPATEDDLTSRLRSALDGEGLELMFQAIVPLHGDAHEQFQALLRLRDRDGGLHAAAELIPAAENAGLLGAVDRWVLERCIGLVAQRQQAGRPLRLLVSQSLHSVRNAWAATRIERLLGEQRGAAAAISLELHAQDAASALADVTRYARAVQALGAGFVLSGFEAGALGEHLLAALPFDAVRLAPSHLQLADAQARDELRELVQRLHEHGRRVIAPRVEDARAASALWAAGVDYVQGNFVQAADSDLGFDFRGSIL